MKKVIIGLSYYSFNFDLEKSKNEKKRIKRVYKPVFSKYKSLNCTFWKMSSGKYFENYFNKNLTREKVACFYYDKKNSKKEELNIQAQNRAINHNKLLKYETTNKENNRILKKLISDLNNRDIEIDIVIFPTTSYYKKYLSRKYKEKFYDNMREYEIEGLRVNLIDLFNFSELDDIDDFIDYDHLSKSGAEKISALLNSRN